MTRKGTHLDAVPDGGPTYAELASATDTAVRTMLDGLRQEYPHHKGAAVAGAIGAVVRFQLQNMPDGSTPVQALQVLAPIITGVAQQVVDANLEQSGRKRAPIGPVSNEQTVYSRLQSVLTTAIVPTYAIWMGDASRIVLVSIGFLDDQVATYGSIPNTDAVLEDPAKVIMAHCKLALAAWRQGAV